MARFEGRTLRNERLNVEGNEFINCNIADCVMVFRGDIPGPSAMTGNVFGERVTWTFERPAQHTLEYLHAMYHGSGDGGREQVENIFATIRRR